MKARRKLQKENHDVLAACISFSMKLNQIRMRPRNVGWLAENVSRKDRFALKDVKASRAIANNRLDFVLIGRFQVCMDDSSRVPRKLAWEITLWAFYIANDWAAGWRSGR